MISHFANDGVRRILLSGSKLFHAIESTAGLEPCNLLLIECMIEFNFVNFAIGMLDFTVNWFTRRQVSQAKKGDFIGRLNLETSF